MEKSGIQIEQEGHLPKVPFYDLCWAVQRLLLTLTLTAHVATEFVANLKFFCKSQNYPSPLPYNLSCNENYCCLAKFDTLKTLSC